MSTAFLQSVCLSVGVWSVLLGGKPAISSGEPPHHSNSHHCLCPCHLSHRAGQQCSHHHHLPPYPCPSGAFIDLSLLVMNYLFAIMIFSPIYPTVNCLLNDKMLCNIISQWLTNVNGMNMAVGGSLATIWTWYRITTSATLIDIQKWSGHKKIETTLLLTCIWMPLLSHSPWMAGRSYPCEPTLHIDTHNPLHILRLPASFIQPFQCHCVCLRPPHHHGHGECTSPQSKCTTHRPVSKYPCWMNPEGLVLV